jgi:hypothetical protein
MLVDWTASILPGDFLKFTYSGNTYFCQVKAITSILLTIRGTQLPTSPTALTALSWDTTNQGEQVNVNAEAAWTSTGVSLAAAELHYQTLDLRKAHLVGVRATLGVADTGAAQPYVEPYLNGSLVAGSVQLSATPGTWTDWPVWSGDISLTYGQSIDVQCPTLGTNKTASHLNMQLVFCLDG